MDRYIAAARAICDNYDLHGYRESDFDPVQDIAETIDGFDAERDQTPASVEWLREVLGEPVEECCDEIAYKQCTLWLDVYPLRGLQWGQKQCVEAIERTGLSVPGKSACFFCPSMRIREIKNLAEQHPDLAERALAMEDNAREAGGLQTVKGLGGFTFSWGSLLRDSLPVIESTPPICDACWDGDEGGFELKG